MFTISVFEDVTKHLQDEIKELRKREFVRSPKEQEEHNDKFTSEGNFKTILALNQKEKPIGRVKLYKRTIKLNNNPVVIGGIGGVWTKKANRKQGIATTLLKKAMEILKEDNLDVAFLSTYIKRHGPMFGKLGFQVLGRRYTFIGKSGRCYFEENGMIAPLNSLDKFYVVNDDTKPLDIGHGNW
jgi:predicted acetyltransferase